MRSVEAAFLVFILLILESGSSYGQQKNTMLHHSGSFRAHYGFIIPHSKKITDISHTNPIGFTADISRINTSIESWKVFNAFWFAGLEAGYFNYCNQQVLGGVISLTPYAEPVLTHGRNYLFTLKMGIGPTYHTVIYDSIANPLNLFFSSRISFRLFLSAKFSYRINENLFIDISGNYNHISNGGVRQPNLGMNFPTASLGLHYFPKGIPSLPREYKNDLMIRPGLTWNILALTGYRVVDKTERYPEMGTIAFGIRTSASKQLSMHYALNAGAEVIFDGAIKETIRRSDLDLDYRRAAVTLGQDFLFGKAIFTQYFGIYVYSPYKARNSTYQKYELSYRINENLIAGVFLKAHAHFAELMGVHLGYLLYRKSK